VGKAAMMREVVDRAFESPEDVEVGGLGCEHHRGGGQGGLAVETGAAQNSAGEEMGDRFQAFFVAQNKSIVWEGCSRKMVGRGTVKGTNSHPGFSDSTELLPNRFAFVLGIFTPARKDGLSV